MLLSFYKKSIAKEKNSCRGKKRSSVAVSPGSNLESYVDLYWALLVTLERASFVRSS